MFVHVELSPLSEVRQDLLLQVVALPFQQGALLKNEESSIDPVIAYQRLFLEPLHLSCFIKNDVAILRPEGDGRQRDERPGALVSLKKHREIDIAKAVSIGRKKAI